MQSAVLPPGMFNFSCSEPSSQEKFSRINLPSSEDSSRSLKYLSESNANLLRRIPENVCPHVRRRTTE
jgi:hypothetical protein